MERTTVTSPIYREQAPQAAKERKELWDIIHSLKNSVPDELYTALNESMARVDRACVPDVPINRAGCPIGFGLNKSQKAIACDQMSAIIKQIKALKGW
jgi:hypothetical protein